MKTSNQNIVSILCITGLMVLVAFTRLIPHPANFTAILAMALFGGAKFKNASFAVLIPLAVMFSTDLFIGFHSLMPLVYGCIALTAIVGIYVGTKSNPLFVIGGSLFSSVLFFLITNGGVWYHNISFPQNMQGLMLCYDVAIPFFRNQLLGDLFFNGVLFGSYSILSKRVLVLQKAN